VESYSLTGAKEYAHGAADRQRKGRILSMLAENPPNAIYKSREWAKK
jgi:hypothetical protein